jgi:excisionase family DNA binding protein
VATAERQPTSPWLTVKDAAKYARCGTKLIYRECGSGRLRHARVGGRRDLRLLAEWIDAWLIANSTPATKGAGQ